MKNSNSKGAFISNNNNNNKANNVTIGKSKKRRNSRRMNLWQIHFCIKEKSRSERSKIKREQQIEYERSQMVDRIKYKHENGEEI